MKVIDQINESGFFAQSAYSADTATNDSLGRNITETYQTTAGMTAYQPSGDYVTTPDLSAYATEQWVNDQSYMYEYMASAFYSADNPSGFITGVDLTPYQTTAGMTAYQPSGDYISAKGFTQRISNTAGNKFLSFWNEAGGSTATAYPAIYLSGQFGSAYYKDNELKLGRNNHTIAFNIGGAGPKISAAATGTVDSLLYVYNAGNSATISQTGFNLKNSTADENVTIATIQNWNAKGDMHESAFAYDAGDKISSYNGSAFSVEQVVTSTGGNANYVNNINNKGISATVSYKARLDEGNHSISALYDTVSTNSASWQTPAGVMMETGLEYNAVNEISAYNGSAIAQYGAEKQWLVHDDTLVHAANSAQYALGVNLSAVAQLLGVDETVLFSGEATNTGNLNESVENFDTIKVNYITDDGMQGVTEFMPNYSKAISLNSMYVAQNSAVWFKATNYTFSSNTSFSSYPYQLFKANNGVTAAWSNNTSNINFRITKVIGIGRKQ